MKIKELYVGYDNVDILKGINLNIENGQFSAIIGPNGAGKSTLLKSLCGFLLPRSGILEIDGRDMKKFSAKDLAKKIALIPQEIQMQFDYPVFDLVMMGRFPYLDMWQSYRKEDKDFVVTLLRELDLEAMQDKFYSQLSGGEKQRVSIARALAQDTEYILMDESFSHLDINHQVDIMNLMIKINQEKGKTIIIVSHNINLTVEYCERIILLDRGKIHADGKPVDVITEANLNAVYGIIPPIMVNPISKNPYILYPGRQC